MSDFKLCENGHYFPKNLDECPYCPKPSAGQERPKKGGGGGSLEKTLLEDDDNQNSLSHTQIFKKESSNTDLGHTKIYGGQESGGGGAMLPDFQSPSPSVGRKLVGWLVSFTIDPLGTDFKLYEGRNLLGSDPGCDVVIMNDPAVSGRHLTILYRMGHFKFKDELSTNGTFINEVFEEEGNLKDGDIIKMGDTIFKFRSIA